MSEDLQRQILQAAEQLGVAEKDLYAQYNVACMTTTETAITVIVEFFLDGR